LLVARFAFPRLRAAIFLLHLWRCFLLRAGLAARILFFALLPRALCLQVGAMQHGATDAFEVVLGEVRKHFGKRARFCCCVRFANVAHDAARHIRVWTVRRVRVEPSRRRLPFVE
jgi:hypothetical protein